MNCEHVESQTTQKYTIHVDSNDEINDIKTWAMSAHLDFPLNLNTCQKPFSSVKNQED